LVERIANNANKVGLARRGEVPNAALRGG